ncbi:MAG: FtsX-like permease family protein, partial [Nitrospirales bacterium]|nr:FtsX-like permease family protein [Nitrospirales bacterium]
MMTMAWRETRAAWRHFLYFFFCIALGVGTLVGVGLFAANVEGTVAREARGLMGGDLEIRLTRPISTKGHDILRSLESRAIDVIHVSELVAMASRHGRETSPSPPSYAVPTQLIELKAIEPSYPFYGTLNTAPPRPVSQLIAHQAGACLATGRVAKTDCYGAIVQGSLLIKMGLQVGDELKIGQAVLTITGTLKHEPDRVASAFSLGPRVMISQDALRSADLVKPGSRVRERYLLRVPLEVQPDPLVTELRDRLADDSAHVSTFREAQPQLRRFLDQLTRYLGLVGLTALFVGGIGVASTVHAFVKDKLKTIAILKTLGADSGTVIRTYLVQALCLGLMGSLAGVTLGASLQHAIPSLLAGLLPIDLLDQSVSQGSLSAEPILRGVALGAATTLLFTLWPLLGIREIRPALIFRTEMVGAEQEGDRDQRRFTWLEHLRDPVRWVTVVLIGIGLSGLAMWQARSLSIGTMFIGALVAAVVLLTLAARMVIRGLRIAASPSSLTVRQAMRNLSRPGSQATSIMVAVGIGVMIIVTISLLERSLIRQIGESRPLNAPTFFFIDLQPDQKAAFERLMHQRFSHVTPELTPLVRSRLHAVNGQPVPINEDDERERRGQRNGEHGKSWYFTREYVLTFLDRLPKDNEVVKGAWWGHALNTQGALVSVEEDAARHLGIDPGSTIEFDIQGTVLPATVSSIRKVEWNNFSTNFYMILSPGSLEGAPFTFVATVRVSPAEEILLQQAVVEAFPNVTAINIGEVMDTFARVLEHLSAAIRAIAVFCMLAGGLVMAAALATTRYRRLYESVIFKALGATRPLIAGSFATEYAFMGAVAGLIGTVLASVLSWGVLYFVFDLPWTLQPGVLIGGLFLTM